MQVQMELDADSSASSQSIMAHTEETRPALVVAHHSHLFTTIMEAEPHCAATMDRGPHVNHTIVSSNSSSSPDLQEPDSPERPVVPMESDEGSSAFSQSILAPHSHLFATIMEPEPHSIAIMDRGSRVSHTIVGSNSLSSPVLLEPDSPERPPLFWDEFQNRQSESGTYTPSYTEAQPLDHNPNCPDEEGSGVYVSPVYEVLSNPKPQDRREDSHEAINAPPLDANALAHNTHDVNNNLLPVYEVVNSSEPRNREDTNEVINAPLLVASATAHNTGEVNNEVSNVSPVYEVVDSPQLQNRREDRNDATNAPEVAESDTGIRIDVFRFNTDSKSSLCTIRPDRAVSIHMDTATQTHEDSKTSNNTATGNEGVNSNISTTFEQPKSRQRENDGEDPQSKMLKRTNSDDGETCPICLYAWGNSEEHRLVALECGHLFGESCVQRWLEGQLLKDRACPTCKSKCQLKDIWRIYAKKVVATDTSQITALLTQIDNLQTEKRRVELELHKATIAHSNCMLQFHVLRSTLMKSQVPKESQVRMSWRFDMEKNLEVCKDGDCRVLTYNSRTYELYVSQKSTDYLFPGYGIRKVGCLDYKLGHFVHLHSKAIRDITYSQHLDLLLSVGLDSSARIVEGGMLNVTVQSGVPLWSCSWDYLRGNEFYVGGVDGVIQQYDIRNPNNYIQRLQVPSDLSPVVSLCSTEFGLLSCQLNTCWLWVQNGSRQWEPRALPLDGPFMSLCYDNESHRALVSCKPGPNNERSRLVLYKLRTSMPTGEVLIDRESTFMGSNRSSLISRATFVKAQNCSWVAAHSESDASLFLHGLDSVAMTRLPSAEPALDVASVQLHGDTLVAALSKSRLRIYKAILY